MDWMDAVVNLSPLAMAFAVFSASVLGSLHCVGMCGPLQTTIAPTRLTLANYHIGRLISYTSLGVAAGFVGDSLFTAIGSTYLAWFVAAVFSAVLLVFALKLFRRENSFHSKIQTKVSVKVMRRVFAAGNKHIKSFLLGTLSPLLPCGWLLSFLIGASLTEDPKLGGLFMFSFCVGTMPGLGILPIVKSKLANRFTNRTNQIAGGLFALTAIAIVVVRIINVYQHTSCH